MKTGQTALQFGLFVCRGHVTSNAKVNVDTLNGNKNVDSYVTAEGIHATETMCIPTTAVNTEIDVGPTSS